MPIIKEIKNTVNNYIQHIKGHTINYLKENHGIYQEIQSVMGSIAGYSFALSIDAVLSYYDVYARIFDPGYFEILKNDNIHQNLQYLELERAAFTGTLALISLATLLFIPSAPT